MLAHAVTQSTEYTRLGGVLSRLMAESSLECVQYCNICSWARGVVTASFGRVAFGNYKSTNTLSTPHALTKDFGRSDRYSHEESEFILACVG